MLKIFKKLFDNEYKELERFKKIADEINALDEEYSKLTDSELANKTNEFKKRLESGATFEDILIEAFATAREAAFVSAVVEEEALILALKLISTSRIAI